MSSLKALEGTVTEVGAKINICVGGWARRCDTHAVCDFAKYVSLFVGKFGLLIVHYKMKGQQ